MRRQTIRDISILLLFAMSAALSFYLAARGVARLRESECPMEPPSLSLRGAFQ